MSASNSYNNNNKQKQFFMEFFQQVQHGLRGSDKTVLETLIADLVKLSQDIPPRHIQYTFREILMLTTLVIEKKLENIKVKSKTHS